MTGADSQGGQPAADLAQQVATLLDELEPSACGNGTAAATHCLKSLSVLTQATQAGAGPDWLSSRLAGLTGRWVHAVLQGANSLEQQVVASVLGESPKLSRAQSCDPWCYWRETGQHLVASRRQMIERLPPTLAPRPCDTSLPLPMPPGPRLNKVLSCCCRVCQQLCSAVLPVQSKHSHLPDPICPAAVPGCKARR